MPKRIQRRRTKGWRMPYGAVYVGRPGEYGNPFTIARSGSHDEAVSTFRQMIDRTSDVRCGWIGVHFICYPSDSQIRRDLSGYDLACWCPLDQPCHADVLLELANTPEGTAT